MIALIDENISFRVAESGRLLGLKMVHVTDPEGPGRGTPDVAMFRWLRDRGDEWVLITEDIKQTRRKHEFLQMRSHQLVSFVLRCPKGQRHPANHIIAAALFSAWPEMELAKASGKRPLIYTFGPTHNFRPLE